MFSVAKKKNHYAFVKPKRTKTHILHISHIFVKKAMEQTNHRYKNNKYRRSNSSGRKISEAHKMCYNLMSIYDYSGTLQLKVYKKIETTNSYHKYSN